MSGINLLTPTVQNEIKINDQRFRPYDDFVIPRYMTSLLYSGRLYDDLEFKSSAHLALQGAFHH